MRTNGHREIVSLLNHLELVIFDLDQTLIDSRAKNEQAVAAFLREIGIPDTPALRYDISTKSSKEIAQSFSAQLGREIKPEEVYEHFVNCYFQAQEGVYALPEAVPLLVLLQSKGITTAAATAAGGNVVEYLLQELERSRSSQPSRVYSSAPLFTAVVSAESGQPHKPEYGAYQLLEQRLGRRFQSDRVLMVGDSDTDQRFAENIGAWFRKIYPEYTLRHFYQQICGSFHPPKNRLFIS